MKIFLFTSLLIFLCSCVNKPSSTNRFEGPSSKSNRLFVKKSPDPAQKEVPGKNAFVAEGPSPVPISSKTAKSITNAIQKALKEKGYVLVDKQRFSHLTVYVQYTSAAGIPESAKKAMKEAGIAPSATSVKITQTKKRIENGKVVLDETRNISTEMAKLNIIAGANEYGKRPQKLRWFSVTSPKKDWRGFETQLKKKVQSHLDFVIPNAPAKNKKMKGDPGCTPRFGFEEANGKVTKVLKGSPAKSAGFKVGDVILSIDSESPYQETDKRVYEARTKVPVKLKRGKKIIRTSIQAKIMCDH